MAEHICGEDCICMAPRRPGTSQLDRAHELTPTSSQIGAFVMEHLAERGYVIARWGWDQQPCSIRWVREPGGRLVRLSSSSSLREGDEELDPFDCTCGLLMTVLLGQPPCPYPHGKWRLSQFSRSDGWINDELALFFGLDPAAMEAERRALLAYIRLLSDQTTGERHDEPARAPEAPR